jgi:PAS domain S-box-containing protein
MTNSSPNIPQVSRILPKGRETWTALVEGKRRAQEQHRRMVVTFLILGSGLFMTGSYGQASGVLDEVTAMMLRSGAFLMAAWPGYYAFRKTLRVPTVKWTLLASLILFAIHQGIDFLRETSEPNWRMLRPYLYPGNADLTDLVAVLWVALLLAAFYFAIESLKDSSTQLLEERNLLNQEIRSRIQTERALQLSEDRFRTLTESTSAGIFIVRGTRCCYANNSAESLVGYGRDELRQVIFVDLIHPEDRDAVREGIEEFYRDRWMPLSMEARVLMRHGTVKWLSLNFGTVYDDGFPSLLVTAFDITGQKSAEKEVRDSQDRFRALVQGSSDVIMVLEGNETIRYVSPSAIRILGIGAPGDLIGKSFLHQVAQEDQATFREAIDDIQEFPGKTASRQIRFAHADGTWRTLEVVVNNMSENPSIRGIVVNSRDITERKGLEDQLRQSQKMDALGRLAGGVAHDFNNLLTTILVRCEFLQDKLKDQGKIADEIEEVRKASERAAALTRQLLTFSRREAAEVKTLDLNATIGDMQKMLTRLLPEDIEFITHLERNLSKIRVDPGHIEQIIMNLVVNARDAMPTGGRLILKTDNRDFTETQALSTLEIQAGPYVVLSVSDTGTGMDEETQSHIFEPFFTTKPDGRGTGLGLATVYGIVKQMGGKISVYSQPGKGTTFRLFIPADQEQIKPILANPQAGKENEGTETILVVEDDNEIRVLAHAILERRGYRVIEAESGEKALEILRNHGNKIDLILSDVVMPGMSGPEMVVQATKLFPETKVLFMSGYTQDAILDRGFHHGRMAFLEKPFTSRILVQKIRDILDAVDAYERQEEGYKEPPLKKMVRFTLN